MLKEGCCGYGEAHRPMTKTLVKGIARHLEFVEVPKRQPRKGHAQNLPEFQLEFPRSPLNVARIDLKVTVFYLMVLGWHRWLICHVLPVHPIGGRHIVSHRFSMAILLLRYAHFLVESTKLFYLYTPPIRIKMQLLSPFVSQHSCHSIRGGTSAELGKFQTGSVQTGLE